MDLGTKQFALQHHNSKQRHERWDHQLMLFLGPLDAGNPKNLCPLCTVAGCLQSVPLYSRCTSVNPVYLPVAPVENCTAPLTQRHFA